MGRNPLFETAEIRGTNVRKIRAIDGPLWTVFPASSLIFAHYTRLLSQQAVRAGCRKYPASAVCHCNATALDALMGSNVTKQTL